METGNQEQEVLEQQQDNQAQDNQQQELPDTPNTAEFKQIEGQAVLKAEGLVKRYGRRTVVDLSLIHI